MKNLSAQILTWLLIFSLIVFPSHAQQRFKWVTGGGSNQSFGSDPVDDWEQTEQICTDADGNIYALSLVGDNAIYADTFVLSTGAYGAYQNILLTSYNCNGQMRWAKLIASNAGPCTSLGIVADDLGNIYVAGSFTNATLYIGYDTTITGLAYEGTGLMQFDTTGNFHWVRFVGDNTPSTYYASSPNALALDGSNNAHMLTYIGSGVHVTLSLTGMRGIYDLVYNTSGTLLSSLRLDLDSEWYLNSVVIDPTTNKMYVSGQNGGGLVTDTFFAAAFDGSRNLIWQYFADGAGALTGVSLDQSKHLYFCGAAGPTAFYFNRDSVFAAGFFAVAILMKTDTDEDRYKWSS